MLSRYIKIILWVLVLHVIFRCSAMDDCWNERLTRILKVYSSHAIDTQGIYFHDDKIYPECKLLGEKNKRDRDFITHAYANLDKNGHRYINFAPHIIDEMNDSIAHKKPFSAHLTQLLLHEYAHHHFGHTHETNLWRKIIFKKPEFSEEYLLYCDNSTDVPEFYESTIAHNFERGQEFTADAWAFERMTTQELKDYLALRDKSAHDEWLTADGILGGLPRLAYSVGGFDDHHPNWYQSYWLAQAILRKKTHKDESSLVRVTRNFFALNRNAQKSENDLKHALAGVLLG